MTQIKSGEEARYVYFAPIKVNNWCVVTVLNSQIIEEQVEYSQKMVRSLILRIIITILIISVIYYKKFVEEKESNDDLSRELNITDKMLRTAISKTREYVFSYDVNTGKLEFLNYDGLHKDIPRVITDFPKNFRKYINGEEKSYKEIERLLEGASQGKREMEGEVSIVQEGKNVIFRIQFTNIVDEDKKSVRVVGTMENITNMRQNEVSLQREEQIRAAILSNTIGFFEIDLNKDHLMQKGELKETKYTFSEIMKEFVERRVDEPYRESVKENFDVERMIHRYHTGVYDNSLEFIRINADGMKLWVRAETRLEKDIVTGDIIALIVVKNIHNEKMQEINLRTQARLDPLTQAYNRGVSVSRINEVLYEYPNQTHAFMLVDLDNFKLINDSLGHVIGDVVLVDVVKILKNHVRERDIVCRLGGDEFGVFLVDIPEEAIARNVTSLIKKLNIKYEKDGKSKLISVSVGIAVAPEHGTTFESLYEKADIAMYEVKNKGKNNYKIYDSE